MDILATPRRRRRQQEAVGAGVPFARSALLFEFYPSQDDAGLRATSGQAFTKTGAPVLLTNGYSFAATEGLQFAGSVLDNIFAASASPRGFTVFVVAGKPFGGLLVPFSFTPAAARALFVRAGGGDYAWACMGYDNAQTVGGFAIRGDIAYNVNDYEGIDDFGVNPLFPSTARVFSTVFDRQHVQAPFSGAWSGTPGEQHAGIPGDAGRLTWYQDGINIVGDGFAPVAPYAAEVLAGTIIVPTGGATYVGAVTAAESAWPRVGSILVYADKLPAAVQVQIAAWLIANKPLAGLTMGPGDLTNNPFVLTNVTAGSRASPTFAVVENADVAQAHSIATTPIVLVNGASVTRTIYVRANPRFRGIFFASTNAGGANRCGINFNLTTQVISNFTSGAGTVSASSITALGEGWFALSFTGAQNGVDVTTATCLRMVDDAGNATYNGDGTSAIQFA